MAALILHTSMQKSSLEIMKIRVSHRACQKNLAGADKGVKTYVDKYVSKI